MEKLQIESNESFGYLGLITAMYKKLKIGEIIDQEITAKTPDKLVSHGQAVLALLILTLGSNNRALYMATKFFDTIDTELLIGPKIKASHLNDSTLGRTLDAISKYGVEKLYTKIALHVIDLLDLDIHAICLDSTTFSFEGQYLSQDEMAVTITYGKSKDNKDDCKQVVLNMAVDKSTGIPVFINLGNGNQSDKVAFGEIVLSQFKPLLEKIGKNLMVIGDSALYTQENIQKNADKLWLTRVPETNTESMSLVRADLEFKPIDDNYQYSEHTSNYGGIKQNWVVIHSKEAHKKDEKNLVKRLQATHAENIRAIKKASKKNYACEADAQEALSTIKKVTERSIKNASLKKNDKGFYLEIDVKTEIEPAQAEKNACGRFILATNNCDKLKGAELLKLYKEQQRVERGFRFLKDDRFFAEAFFLKSNKRIEALIFVMSIGLMVYNCLEYEVRKKLKENDSCFLNQKNKPIQNPTIRWVFQVFETIRIVKIKGYLPTVTNLTDVHINLLKLLGHEFESGYI